MSSDFVFVVLRLCGHTKALWHYRSVHEAAASGRYVKHGHGHAIRGAHALHVLICCPISARVGAGLLPSSIMHYYCQNYEDSKSELEVGVSGYRITG